MTARRTAARLALVTTALGGSLAVSVSSASTARAARSGSGELQDGTLGVEIEVSTGAQPGTDPSTDGSPSTSRSSLVHYVWTAIPGGPLGSLEGLCNAGGTAATVAQPVFGWLYRVEVLTRDGRVVSDTLECVAFPDPTDTSTPPPPPVPPTPPTVGDVWRAVALPRPTVGVNPVRRGVTGLDSEMWSGGAQTAQVAVTIGGFRVIGIARVVEYRFATDEGAAGSSVTAGSAAHPAAAHRFARKGAHSLSVSSVWTATVTMVGPGGAAPVPINIDTAVLTATVSYPVVEVRTRLVG